MDNNPVGRAATAASFVARTTPVVPPIYQSATFLLDDAAYADVQAGGLHETWYSRFSNPTVMAAAEEVRRRERAQAALLASSGMAAIATTLLTLVRAGERIVAARELYGDTRDLLGRDLPALGIQVDLVDVTDPGAWRAALAAGPAVVAYAESLSNPQLKLLDVPVIAGLAHAAGARLVVDNTFASPYLLRPLEYGADLVVESATKYLSGHSDVIAGAVAGPAGLVEEVQRRIITFGGCLDPHAAFLVWRGLQTFEVRLARQNDTAAALAAYLAGRPDITEVIYPGLASHPQHALACGLLEGGRGGAMVTFVVDGGDERALGVMRQLRVACEATSLGGVETLASTPFNSSHFSLSAAQREAAGIMPGMIRLSAGVEPPQDIIADLAQALDACPAALPSPS
ncbi:MAG TPA: aminotransferase class I/II-fold pyridoxal phosphate-dependent enzyme [Streptosporangiaceae bacterium]|jgi:cystathionine beta-lyase/cystathionine gamma-synthase